MQDAIIIWGNKLNSHILKYYKAMFMPTSLQLLIFSYCDNDTVIHICKHMPYYRTVYPTMYMIESMIVLDDCYELGDRHYLMNPSSQEIENICNSVSVPPWLSSGIVWTKYQSHIKKMSYI